MKIMEGQNSHLCKSKPGRGYTGHLCKLFVALADDRQHVFGAQTGPVMSTILAYFDRANLVSCILTAQIVFFTYFYTFNVSFARGCSG